MKYSREEITERYRKLKDHRWGRLYWKKRGSRFMRNRFESDDVAIIKEGVYTMHYKSVDALLEAICHVEKIVADDWVERFGNDPMFWTN